MDWIKNDLRPIAGFDHFTDSGAESLIMSCKLTSPTKTVKRASKVLIEKYYPRLTLDFQTNKKIASEVAIIPSKRLRNKIAGFTTHLMKRIQRGPVRGISFKLQEEERERKDNYIPEVSALDTSAIEIDTETQNLLKSLNFEELAGVTAIEVKQAVVETRKPRGDRKERA
ncbi:40S ribosomal protein S17 [Mortierella alpina]|nr:40S ribosomal protein S17 [Mortierella alpina]